MGSDHGNLMDGGGGAGQAVPPPEDGIALSSTTIEGTGVAGEDPEVENIDTGSTGEKSDLAITLQSLTDVVHALRNDFQHSTQTYDQHRALVDKLHSENEQLRRAELERARDPVVRDLISLADTCLRNGRAWLQRETVTPGDVAQVLRGIADDVEMILERQGVERFMPETGTKFDRREARGVRSTATPDASLDGTVAEVLRPGYRVGNRVVRYCEVVVHAFEGDPAINAQNVSHTEADQ